MTKKTDNSKKMLAFSAIDPYLASNIVEGVEKEVRGFDFITWGEQNDYPDYLLSLYKNVPTLQSIINGAVDFTCGDDAALSNVPFDVYINDKKETVNQLLRQISYDYWIYGAFAINVVRNRIGKIAGLYYINAKNVRSDKRNDRFWYAEDWGKSYGRVKFIEYPKFDINGNEPSSIVYVKNNYTTVYGIPVYGAATKAAEIMKSIDEYHLNSINNGFVGSYIISFNNGVPSPEIQEEIEEELNEKFTGKENAGRILVSFNKDKDSQTTVQKLEQEDWGEKYNSLADWSQKQLFTAFRANPNIFGIATEGTGFSGEEYENTFKLFNRTMIRPVQRLLCDTFACIFGEEVLEIKPFTLESEGEKMVD